MRAKAPAKRERESDCFRQQHQLRSIAEREVEGVRRPVLVNDAESPLGWLKSRKDRNGAPGSPTTNTPRANACAPIIGSRILVRG